MDTQASRSAGSDRRRARRSTRAAAVSVRPPVPWGGLPARLRASVTARRLVPTELALIATDAFCRIGLRLSPDRMAYAVAAADAVVGGTPAESELTDLAVRHVQARARAWELLWRPWQLHRIPIEGLEHLTAARATGRGLIVSFTHLGPTTGWAALGPRLAPVVLLTNDRVDAEPPPGYQGYQLEHRRQLFREAGIDRVPAAGSAMAVYKVLVKGGTVMLAADWPGERRTTFLGRPVDLADGTPTLAMKTGALVMPAAMLPRGRRWRIRLHAPLDPKDYTEADDLHEAVLGIHEGEIRANPEHLVDPRELWSNASRRGWFRE